MEGMLLGEVISRTVGRYGWERSRKFDPGAIGRQGSSRDVCRSFGVPRPAMLYVRLRASCCFYSCVASVYHDLAVKV